MSKFAPKIKPKLKQMYKSFLFLFSHFVVFQPFKDSAFVHSVFQSLHVQKHTPDKRLKSYFFMNLADSTPVEVIYLTK